MECNFLSNEQRGRLKEAINIIESVKSEIDFNPNEYPFCASKSNIYHLRAP